MKFSLQVNYHGGTAHTIAFLKRESFPHLELRGDDAGDVSKQLQMINLGFVGEDFNIFELAATYVEYSLIPVLNSYKLSKGKGDSGTASGFENIQKNLA